MISGRGSQVASTWKGWRVVVSVFFLGSLGRLFSFWEEIMERNHC